MQNYFENQSTLFNANYCENKYVTTNFINKLGGNNYNNINYLQQRLTNYDDDTNNYSDYVDNEYNTIFTIISHLSI